MQDLDKKILQVLDRLGEQADRERSDEAVIPDDERMLAITKDTGIYFNILLKAIRVRRILEIGTSIGYSTLWFSDAIKYNSDISLSEKSIVTIDGNPAKIKRARKNFEEAGVSNMIETREGLAVDVLKEMLADYQNSKNQNAVQFDFIFIDADKENVIAYFDLVFPMLRTGGIIAADNILSPEPLVAEMAKYCRYVRSRQDVQSVTVPIGMGEEITIKLH